MNFGTDPYWGAGQRGGGASGQPSPAQYSFKVNNYRLGNSNFSNPQLFGGEGSVDGPSEEEDDERPGQAGLVGGMSTFGNRTPAAGRPDTRGSTPSNVGEAFNSMRPATASSGIGGLIEDDKFGMGKTHFAGAGSPIKVEKGRMRKWVQDTGMQNPGAFYPSVSDGKENSPLTPENASGSSGLRLHPAPAISDNEVGHERPATQERRDTEPRES